MKSYSKLTYFHSRKCIWKCRLEHGGHLSRPQCVNIALPKHAFIFTIQYIVTVSGWIKTCHTDTNSESKEKVEGSDEVALVGDLLFYAIIGEYHDDVIKWRHFPPSLAFCGGNPSVTVVFYWPPPPPPHTSTPTPAPTLTHIHSLQITPGQNINIYFYLWNKQQWQEGNDTHKRGMAVV